MATEAFAEIQKAVSCKSIVKKERASRMLCYQHVIDFAMFKGITTLTLERLLISTQGEIAFIENMFSRERHRTNIYLSANGHLYGIKQLRDCFMKYIAAILRRRPRSPQFLCRLVEIPLVFCGVFSLKVIGWAVVPIAMSGHRVSQAQRNLLRLVNLPCMRRSGVIVSTTFYC